MKIKNEVEKIKENKALKLIGNILYTILVIIVLMVLFLVALQRYTNNQVTVGGIRIFNIVSESMIPKYKLQDVLIAKEVDTSTLKIGDDIAYQGKVDSYAGKIITHQIINIREANGKTYFTTKGINNEYEDPDIEADQVYGKIIYKTKILSALSKLMNNIYGFYFIVFVPLTLLVFFEVRKFIRARREEKEEEEAEKSNSNKEDKKEETKEEDSDNNSKD